MKMNGDFWHGILSFEESHKNIPHHEKEVK